MELRLITQVFSKKTCLAVLSVVTMLLFFSYTAPVPAGAAELECDTATPCEEDTTPFNPVSPEACTGSRAESVLCKANVDQGPRSDNRLYGPSGVLTKAANILSIVIGVASVIVIIVGGLQYVLSAGDSSKVNTAKNTILYALVGLVITAFARLIIIFVLERVG